MDMDVAAVFVSVRVSTDQGLVSRELLGTKSLSQLLRLVHRQPVTGTVTRIKAEYVVVTFYIFSLLVFSVTEIGAHTGNSEIFTVTVEGGDAVILAGNKPPVLVQNGLACVLVMLEKQVLLRRAVVSIF